MTLQPGSLLGSYEIVSQLGTGGMGEVYRALDPKLGRNVAVKVLPESLARNSNVLSRFEREAKALARLNHPNVAVVHGFEQDGDTSYLVMELVEGETLDRRIPPGGLDSDEFLGLATPLAEALGQAHRQGIVHRDLKPANVMVSSEGRLKVLDFGLAKLVAEETVAPDAVTQTAQEELTREGAVMGTVPYMSPEQLRGEPVDARSDVFSLGVVLYEMATGRRPFGGGGVDLVSAILRDTPAPIGELNARLPGPVGELVQRCLSKSPADRPADAGAVWDALSAIETTRGADEERAHRGRGLTSRGLLAAVAAVVVLASAVLLLWRSPLLRGEREARVATAAEAQVPRLAVLPFANLGLPAEEHFADGLTLELINRLSGLRNLAVTSRTSSVIYKGTDKSARDIGEELGVDYVLRGSVRLEAEGELTSVTIVPQLVRTSDASQMWSRGYERPMVEGVSVQAAIASEVVGELGVALSAEELRRLGDPPTSNALAYEAYLRGLQVMPDGHGPEAEYRQAEAMLNQAVSLDPEFAVAWTYLAEAHLGIYWFGYDVTEERLAMAFEAVQRALELDPDDPEARFALGDYYYRQRDYDRALKELAEVFELRPNDSRVISHIAFIWRRQGLWDQAISNQERAVRLNPNDLGSVLELCYSYAKVGDFERSLALHQRGAQIDPNSEWVPILGAFVYWLRDEQGDLERARDALKHFPNPRSFYPASFRIHQELFEGNYAAAQRLIDNLAVPAVVLQGFYEPRPLLAALTWRASGDSASARAAFEEAVRVLEAEIARNRHDPRLPSALGIALAGLGKRDEAVEAGRRGMELLPVERDHLLGLFRVYDMVRIYAMLGENDAALEELRLLVSMPNELGGARLTRAPELAALREDPRFWDLGEGYHVPRRRGPR